MAKWIYICKGGTELRRLIDDADTWENSVEIIRQLKRCYQEIIDNYDWEDDWDKGEFQEALELLEGDDVIIESCANGLEDFDDYGFEDDEEFVNERLREFYDLCDSYRIWVEVQ